MIEKLGLIIPAATLTKIAGNLGKGKTGKKNVERLFFFLFAILFFQRTDSDRSARTYLQGCN